MKETAFAYLRVSSKGQTDGDGFDRQLAEIQKYTKKHKAEVTTVFKEDVSGTTGEDSRPQFQEMVSDLLKNGCRTVIVERLDRLAREYRIQESLIIFLASKGINVISAATEENVTEAMQSDPMKKALIQMQGVFAELEKSLLVKKLRSARDRKKQATGKCEGRKTFAETNPELLAEVHKLRKKKKGKARLPFAKIAKILNAAGFTNSVGGPLNGKNLSAVYHRNKTKI